MPLSEALQRLAQQAPEVEYFACEAAAPAAGVNLTGEPAEVLHGLADAYGLELGELLGVAILAPSSPLGFAEEPGRLLETWAPQLPEPLRTEVTRFAAAKGAEFGQWAEVEKEGRAELEAAFRQIWSELERQERPASGLATVPVDEALEPLLRQAMVGAVLRNVLNSLAGGGLNDRDRGAWRLEARSGADGKIVDLTLTSGGRRRIGTVRLDAPLAGDRAAVAAPGGLERPAPAVVLTRRVTLEGRGRIMSYASLLAAAARLDGCRLESGEDYAWRLRDRPVWQALDVQGIARGRVWSPPADAWVYGDAPASACSTMLASLSVTARARVWDAPRSRDSETLAALDCWEALTEAERATLLTRPLRSSELTWSTARIIEQAAVAAGAGFAVRQVAREMDRLGEATLYADIRWWPEHVTADYGCCEPWSSRRSGIALVAPPAQPGRPPARPRVAQPDLMTPPLGRHTVSRW
jgi:hypothetical protein